jgi:hypothetical protein
MFHLEIGKEPVNVSPAGTALPYTHEPYGVKTIAGQASQLSLEHVTQTDRATGLPGQVVDPGPGIDLIAIGLGGQPLIGL